MRLSIAKEAAVSFVINAMLSLLIFLAAFRGSGATLSFGPPDGLGIDFLPQSGAVALMSALVPALVARARWRKAGSVGPALRPILLRAALLAGCGLLLGAFLAWLSGQGGIIGWRDALGMKLLYGGLLGAAMTTIALKRMVR